MDDFYKMRFWEIKHHLCPSCGRSGDILAGISMLGRAWIECRLCGYLGGKLEDPGPDIPQEAA
jgi:rubredoxin